MWYIYVIESSVDESFYVGITNDLRKRLNQHNLGKVYSTKRRLPYKLVYYEAHSNKHDAADREQFLKIGWGKNWIKRAPRHYIAMQSKKLGG